MIPISRPETDILETDNGFFSTAIGASVATERRVPIPPANLDLPGAGTTVRFRFLDGLRGLTALNVLLYHTLGAMDATGRLTGRAGIVQKLFSTGHPAVGVFIVLSGFSLMLPVARSTRHELRGGLGAFFWRRGLRILPAYYAAVALGIFVTLATSPFGTGGGRSALTAGSVLSHLLLLQNLFPTYVWTINAAHWSVPLECQIYVLFAFVLLPLWRKTGPIATIGVAFACPAALMFFLPPGRNLTWTDPWYLGLFAVGMAAAAVGPVRHPRAVWGAATSISLAAFFAAHHARGNPGVILPWTAFGTDALLGFAVAFFILYCVASSDDRGPTGWPTRFLSSGPLTFLGLSSYSLYLVHASLLDLSLQYTGLHHYSAVSAWTFRAVFVVPASLLVGWGWSRLFERPFMSRPSRR